MTPNGGRGRPRSEEHRTALKIPIAPISSTNGAMISFMDPALSHLILSIPLP
jgi:hypothetical protein